MERAGAAAVAQKRIRKAARHVPSEIAELAEDNMVLFMYNDCLVQKNYFCFVFRMHI